MWWRWRDRLRRAQPFFKPASSQTPTGVCVRGKGAIRGYPASSAYFTRDTTRRRSGATTHGTY